jgi:hypothetical protein
MTLPVHRRAALLALLTLLIAPVSRAQQTPATAATEDPRLAEFKQLAALVVELRRTGADESEELQEKTLKILDSFALEQLNRSGPRDLAAINQHFAATLKRPGAVGEGYELVQLGANAKGEVSYALVVNFSLSGPSAIRFYSPSAQGYHFAARIDRWEFPDYFDEYAELLPIAVSDIVFVTVNGRTDELRTGTFAAWHFTDGRFTAVWTSDILEGSAYELRPDGFHLSFCSQSDEQNPRLCQRITRERFQWDGFAWRSMEHQESAAPKPEPPPQPPKRKP